MSDDAYLEAENRDPRFIDRVFTYGIAQSHAVLDSVAQELADYARKAPHIPGCSIFGPTDSDRLLGVWMESDRKCTCGKEDSLMRFDNLNKKAGTE